MTPAKEPRLARKRIRHLAKLAGAQTEGDYAFFACLVEIHRRLVEFVNTYGENVGRRTKRDLRRHQFLLERGQFFRAQALPPEYEFGEISRCHENSFELAQMRPGLAYCEGFLALFAGDEQVPHCDFAWCATADGNVVDVTFKHIDTMSYFGVAYTAEEIASLGGGEALPLINQITKARLKGPGKRVASGQRPASREKDVEQVKPRFDQEQVDDATLALLWLTMWQDSTGTLSWKGNDWTTLDRLHAKGYIGAAASKAKSVDVTEVGRIRAEELFRHLFQKP